MDKKPRVYLAGPDIFFDRPIEIGQRLKTLCEAVGLIGIFPLDTLLQDTPDRREVAFRIYLANCELIRGADAVCANLLPFRGPSADVGTVWELGYAQGLGKSIVGYSHNRRMYSERVLPDNFQVENFGLRDNLMFAVAMDIYDSPEQALEWLASVFKVRTEGDR